MQSPKTMLRLGVAFLIAMGFSATAQAQWTALANPPPGFLDGCLVLTDGTVMCHRYNSNQWHRLTPDINGSYANGTWSNLADMPDGNDPSFGCTPCTYEPLYFATAVLADGRVVVIGGEYVSLVAVWTNIGFVYDPVSNSWTTQLIEVFGGGSVGDSMGIILADGTFVLSDIFTGNMESLDLGTLTFTALNPPGKDCPNNEENWNILPDGTFLTVDAHIPSSFEIYDPVTNAWLPAGATPVNLADCCGAPVGNSKEVGPGVLRPDGTLIYFSGNSLGQNAAYDTASGTWSHTAAMDFPLVPGQTYHFSVADGPASLLPNGNVIVQASPVKNGDPFNTPSHFYEWDGTNLTQVADSPNAASFASYQGRMVLLPSGQVLLTAYDQDATQDVVLYSNGGSPQDAWRPVITSSPGQVVSGNTYPISGRLFNGFSEGASYGDDAQSSTNYPLVRITNIATGHVFYARTHDHSRMGVEPVGSAEIVTTQFDGPAGLEPGPSNLVVVVNGIPSLPVVINLIATTITVQPATEDYHDVVTLQATVTPPGVSGTVEFFVDGSSVGFASYNRVTGVATLGYLIQLPSGTYDLRADFTSTNPDYANSTATLRDGLTVTPEETTLSYTGDTVIANGGTATMSGVLLEDGVVPIAGRTVHFTLGVGATAQTCDGVTNASGIATCSISPVAQPLGPGVVTASFAGDAFYQPALATAATLIFAFADGGAFTVGDLSSPIGAHVLFWGSQWVAVNALSGGPAPSAFKGFANNVSSQPPTCGSTWTSRPGNGSNPPATVPSFMGVLVPTTVTKSGSKISGDVWAIVIVQTDPGYGPSPGKKGTGTVIANFCHP